MKPTMPLASKESLDRKMQAHAGQDRRLAELFAANKLPLPDNELLANIHRRRGDLQAAATEILRLHASGNASPVVALFHAIFTRQGAPARMPETDFAPAPFVVLDDFLGRETNRRLLDDALARESIFTTTELQNSDEYGRQQRTNLVTYDVGAAGEALCALVRQHYPLVCARLNMPAPALQFIQRKIAAYRHGDYFNAHQDNGLNHKDRRISFVYYFHQEPKPYRGGDLLLYDSRFDPRAYVRTLFTRIVPRNDSIIFFPSEYFHEVVAVDTDVGEFSASRFTIAGHLG